MLKVEKTQNFLLVANRNCCNWSATFYGLFRANHLVRVRIIVYSTLVQARITGMLETSSTHGFKFIGCRMKSIKLSVVHLFLMNRSIVLFTIFPVYQKCSNTMRKFSKSESKSILASWDKNKSCESLWRSCKAMHYACRFLANPCKK